MALQSILPPKALAYLGRIIDLGGKLKVMPYTWDRNTNRAQFKNLKQTKVLYFALLSLVLLYQVFLIWQCTVFVRSGKESLQTKFRACYKTLVYITVNVQHLVTVQGYGELHHLINSFMTVTQSINERHGLIRIDSENKILRVMKTASFVICLSASNALGVFLAPQSPTLFTSMFENPSNLNFAVKFLIGSIHVVINVFHLYPILLNCCILLCYVYTVIPVVRRFCVSRNDDKPFAMEQVKFYTQLTILQNNFNRVYSTWTIGMEVFVIYVVVFNIFQAVIFESLRALIIAFASCLVFFTMITEFSNVNKESLVTLESWKRIVRPDWFLKYRRASKPLSVTIGSFYFADRGLPLTFMTIIFTNAANLIVAFRK